MRAIDLSGATFGHLSVLRKTGKTKSGNMVWDCKCTCGKIVSLPSGKLRRGHVSSCGCFRSEYLKNNAKYAGRKPIGEACVTRIFHHYKHNARARNLDFNLTREEFKNLIFQPCFYCDAEPKNFFKFYDKTLTEEWKKLNQLAYNGIDRKNSKFGYDLENCVPCCSICNQMKMDLTIQHFANHIGILYEKFKDGRLSDCSNK